jgi:hypothetical protein
LLAPGASAGEARVNWVNPEKFTDIRSGEESPADALNTVKTEFKQIFARLSKHLPQGYVMEVSVEDVDLAGEVRYRLSHSTKNYRIVKDIDWPKLKFSYSIRDEQQREVASGKEELRDLDFAAKINTSNSQFKFEEQMLKDWFKREHLVQKVGMIQK